MDKINNALNHTYPIIPLWRKENIYASCNKKNMEIKYFLLYELKMVMEFGAAQSGAGVWRRVCGTGHYWLKQDV